MKHSQIGIPPRSRYSFQLYSDNFEINSLITLIGGNKPVSQLFSYQYYLTINLLIAIEYLYSLCKSVFFFVIIIIGVVTFSNFILLYSSSSLFFFLLPSPHLPSSLLFSLSCLQFHLVFFNFLTKFLTKTQDFFLFHLYFW